MSIRPVVIGAVALGLLLAAPAARALEAAGSAVGVDPDAVVESSSDTRTIEIGSDLFLGERVVTTRSGLVQILFSDNTRMVVGPNSQLVIEQYLMRNDETVSRFAVDALAGSFRFITGDSPKNAYEINTPTGTISVRGTAFDFDVDQDTGEVFSVVFNGIVRQCPDDAPRCIELRVACQVGVMEKQHGAHVIGLVPEQLAAFEDHLPFTSSSQRALRRDFRVSNASDCRPQQVAEGHAAPPPPPPPPPPPEDDHHHDNNGWGNGGEGDEGDEEGGNPGRRGFGFDHGHGHH